MNALRHMRESLNRSQYEMADYLGIPQPTYASYETGHRPAPMEIAEKVTIAYNRDRSFFSKLPQIIGAEIQQKFPNGILSEGVR